LAAYPFTAYRTGIQRFSLRDKPISTTPVYGTGYISFLLNQIMTIMRRASSSVSILCVAAMFLVVAACSKSSDPPPPANPCAGKTITVNITGEVKPGAGLSNGSITVTATGSSGFTFNINGGAFQSSGTFSNLAAGNYTITAKDASGCTGTRAVNLITDPCIGKNITVSLNATSSDKCNATGTITVNASGGTGFMYKLGTGSFQAGSTFNNVAAGTYTVIARDGDGCEKSEQVTVAALADGPLFLAVRQVIRSNCGGGGSGCHLNGGSSGGQNFEFDCNIVAARERIYQRAVVAGTMPPTGPLAQADKDKITAWRNAGGGAGVRE
jgi:hypothetical protein